MTTNNLDPKPIVYINSDGSESRITTAVWTLPETFPHRYRFAPRPGYAQDYRDYPREGPTVTMPTALWDEVHQR